MLDDVDWFSFDEKEVVIEFETREHSLTDPRRCIKRLAKCWEHISRLLGSAIQSLSRDLVEMFVVWPLCLHTQPCHNIQYTYGPWLFLCCECTANVHLMCFYCFQLHTDTHWIRTLVSHIKLSLCSMTAIKLK